MKKILIIITLFLLIFTSLVSATVQNKNYKYISQKNILEYKSKDIIVFTANQGWLSRIYLLDMSGSIINYFEYNYYIFCDLEVVNNQLYAVDWVAPRLYRVDLNNGALEVIVDDWNLIYMYDVAYDGTYFYIDEWDLNRYDLNGSYQGTVSFDLDVRGSAYDGSYYWTLTDDNVIKCWDISSWPTVTEITENMFSPPSTNCRGLWFDGTYFWSAESIDGSLGYIYQFDYSGDVISQWLEPAFMGYSACVIKDFLPNNPPNKPDIEGELNGIAGEEYIWTFKSIDPDNDQIYYWVDWGDGNNTEWIGPYTSNTQVEISHVYTVQGNYSISSKAKDIYDEESDWSYLDIKMPFNQPISKYHFQIINKLLERFPLLQNIISNFIKKI